MCTDLRADDTLRRMASSTLDEKIMPITTRDIVAAEAHYHRSCYRVYTRTNDHKRKTQFCQPDPNDEIYHNTEKNAFIELHNFIRNNLLQHPRVMRITELTEMLVDHMKEAGVREIKSHTRKHVRRNLEKEFGDIIRFFADDNGRLLVMPEKMTVFDLARENQRLLRIIEPMQNASNRIEVVDKAAQVLRSVIKDRGYEKPWPIFPDTLNDFDEYPPELKAFFMRLLTGESHPESASQRVKWLIDSFSQDMVYAIKENETDICLSKLATSSDEDALLPETIQPHAFTTLAWDNIDNLEETLTGAGTSHRVNGIVVQPRMFGPDQRRERRPIAKTNRRSITAGCTNLPIYNSGVRCGPAKVVTLDCERKSHETEAFRKTFLWVLSRITFKDNQIIPGWTGFNISSREDVRVLQDNIGYLPLISAPATNMSTCAEILKKTDAIRRQLEVRSVVVVLDQALYAKVSKVLWKHKEEFPGVVLRLGTFHTICNLLSIIGKRNEDAGLRDLCIESGVLAEGSVTAVMGGKHYNRAVRIHKYIFKALMRLAWKKFISWLESTHPSHLEDTETFDDILISWQSDQASLSELNSVAENDVFTTIFIKFLQYLDFLRSSNGPLSAFWMSYIDMIGNILLGLIRASREGDWNLHLSAIRNMIPWCFAYDKTNYLRYLPLYYAEMTGLQESHPEVYSGFQNGLFSMQLGAKNYFARIPVDQTIEETANRDTKSHGGIRRFSLKEDAVSRYFLTSEYRCSFMRQFRDMLGLSKLWSGHSELTGPRIRKDEEAVAAVVETLNNWINPFDGHEEIISLSTATAPKSEIAQDLQKAIDVGEHNCAKFKMERLEADSQKKFFEPIPKNKLLTFWDLRSKKKITSSKGKEIIMKADRNLFSHMILVAKTRKDFSLRDVFTHPLGPLPWSLVLPDGSMRKTTKAVLAKELRKDISFAESIPHPSATIIDGMALVQRSKGEQKTFSELAVSLLKLVFREGGESSRIDIVFDVYKNCSTKNAERLNRSSADSVQYRDISGGQVVRQWLKFLHGNDNKAALTHFLVEEWSRNDTCEKLLAGKTLFVTLGTECYKLSSVGGREHVSELFSNQEEADTRLILHVVHAATSGWKSVDISSDDTDVLVLCVSFANRIDIPLFLKNMSGGRTHYVDVKSLVSAIGTSVSEAILGLHTFTGCDTVSAFAGRRKTAALKLLKQNTCFQNTFVDLGTDWQISQNLYVKLEKFVCKLYSSKLACVDVNSLRYDLFCSKKGKIESYQLPPCADSLYKHAQRANYQAAIWKRALENNPEIPPPEGHGWKIHQSANGPVLDNDWMDGNAAPEEVLELLSCDCSRSCKAPSCPCINNGIRCTDICKAAACENKDVLDDEGTNIENTSDDDEGDDDSMY